MEVLLGAGTKSVIEIGLIAPSFFRPGVDGSDSVGGKLYPSWDYIPRYLYGTMFVRTMHTENCNGRKTGLSRPAPNISLSDSATPPRTIVYNASKDFDAYGDIISNALRVAKGWSKTDFTRDNSVVHTDLYGSAMSFDGNFVRRYQPGPAFTVSPYGYGSLPGITIDNGDLPSAGRAWNYSITYNTNGTTISPNWLKLASNSTLPISHTDTLLPALVDAANGGTFDVTIKPGSYFFTFSYSNASLITKDGRATGIAYEVGQEAKPLLVYPVGNEYYKRRWRLEYEFSLGTLAATLPYVTGTFPPGALPNMCRSRVEMLQNDRRVEGVWVDQGVQSPRDNYSWPIAPTVRLMSTPTQESPPAFTDYMSSPYAEVMIPSGVHEFASASPVPFVGRCGWFELSCNKVIEDVRSSASISAGDAFSQAFDVLTTNHIETIAELKQIGALLSPLEVFRRWWRIAKGKDSWQDPFQIINDLTDLQLAYSFAIRPTISAAAEIVEKSTMLLDRLKHGYPDVVVGKGTFKYTGSDLSDALGHPNCELITRSKVVVAMSSSSVLMTILGARALGILPSLSNMWDLVPFSFMIDWFTRLGDRIEELDTQIFAKCVDLSYCTHSFTITSGIDTDDLMSYGLTAGYSMDVPNVRWYRREKSRWFPALRDSQFDWHSTFNPPDWKIVGSTLYKLTQ